MARVESEDQLGLGLREFRFVPYEWESPVSHHRWYVVRDTHKIAYWRGRLEACPPVTWHLGNGQKYTADVSFSLAHPQLVHIGGIL